MRTIQTSLANLSTRGSLMIGKVLCLFVLITVLISANSSPGTNDNSSSFRKYQIMAAFLYNFAKFVEWPNDTFTDTSSTITLGVLGEDPFGVTLESIRYKTVRGRKLVIKRFDSVRNLEFCHILFISSSEEERLPQILKSLNNLSVLTVGEMDQFTQFGGIIKFIIQKNKIRFEINVDNAERAGLKISSRLLKLAKVVKNERHAKEN